MVYVFTRVLRFPDNTVIAWIKDNYHEQGNIIITLFIIASRAYFLHHSVMHHHNELKVTKCLVTGSCITVRVKWLGGNETERGIGIPTIESRACNVPIDKGNCIQGCSNPRHRGSSDEIIEEHVGANMGIQITLLVIDRRAISVMSACLPNP